jgi:hypothetical protein
MRLWAPSEYRGAEVLGDIPAHAVSQVWIGRSGPDVVRRIYLEDLMSKEWTAYVGLVGALLALLGNQAGIFPAAWYPFINAGAAVVGLVAAFLKDNRSIFLVK